MKNRTLIKSWQLFRRLSKSRDNAHRQMRTASTAEQMEKAVRRVNCAEHLICRLSQYLNKHTV